MSRGPNPTPDDEQVPEGTGSNEMFYTDENGKKQDSDLHEEMFANGADDEQSVAMYRQAIADGMDPELAESLFG